ncbi:SpoIID/LytB domain-containing protein [Nocardioides jejuensis]|nr:SpoIID/LytB domain-containing protein [Nocardioides jejuensis]
MRRGAFGLTTAILSSVLVLSGLEASPASASTTTYTMPATGKVTLSGHGYGHGHGMSQYGAQGAATGNWGTRGKTPLTWQQIVAFYYPGTKQATFAQTIRVKISADTSADVVIEARSKLQVLDVATGTFRSLPRNGATRWRLTPAAGGQTAVAYLIGTTWTTWLTLAGDAAFTAQGEPMRLFYDAGSRQYRGRLYSSRPSATSTDRDTINQLSLEDYLRGVVPSEMPASWNVNAVSAQAVAARTYAAYELQHPLAAYYDICDTSSCQVYGGYDAEWPNSNNAIDATKGVILSYGGKPAFTQFSASSGGWTSAGDASMPYLSSKSDPYDDVRYPDGTSANSHHSWTVAVNVADIEKKTGIGDIAKATVLMNDNHHVSKITFIGTKGRTYTVYGDTFRSWFGLKSTYFAITGRPTTTA